MARLQFDFALSATQETPCATIFQSAANCVNISRCWAEYIVAINISIRVSRGAKLNSVELRKLQMTGGASYTVSLPKDWVKEQGLKVGDVVAIMPRSDSSLTLIPHEKIPTGKNRGAE